MATRTREVGNKQVRSFWMSGRKQGFNLGLPPSGAVTLVCNTKVSQVSPSGCSPNSRLPAQHSPARGGALWIPCPLSTGEDNGKAQGEGTLRVIPYHKILGQRLVGPASQGAAPAMPKVLG